jgi:ABC-type multidrug transport system permease subunit
VFERERLNGHYGLTSFVFAHTLSSAPYLLLISVIPGAIVYVMVDLHHGFLHFLYFVLMLYSAVLVVESLMIMIASIVPDFLLGIIVGAGVQVGDYINSCRQKPLTF